jgi:hypothetical protein
MSVLAAAKLRVWTGDDLHNFEENLLKEVDKLL